jgi:hypothetical protein
LFTTPVTSVVDARHTEPSLENNLARAAGNFRDRSGSRNVIVADIPSAPRRSSGVPSATMLPPEMTATRSASCWASSM